MLQVETLKLMAEYRYLSQTPEFKNGTPSNYIIFKVLPNIGATHGEILLYKWRNSIILEPNIPVLIGKRDALNADGTKMYPNILVVFKGVTESEVRAYLSSEIKPKKILCTPEAYESKVKPAILKNESYELYQDFFLLLDECDRLIKDVEFRDKIILPMDDFFKFNRKAMISATALEPSDKRFANHGFKILKVEPQYDYSCQLDLIATNNIIGTLRKILEKPSTRKMFIFLNSTEFSLVLVRTLGIEHQTKIFCAPKSVNSLAKAGFQNAHSDLQEFARYNVFTSRFFSAVDMKIDEQPNVLMITDVYRARFSMVDAYTDAVQISGRLRNGIHSLIHVTNFDSNLMWMDDDSSMKYIDECYQEYKKISEQPINLQEGGAIETRKQALIGTNINSFIDSSNELNNFMVDNFLLKQRVRKSYTGLEQLKVAYQDTGFFNIKARILRFDITDSNLITLQQNKNNCIRYETVANMLEASERSSDGVINFYLGESAYELRRNHPDVALGYDALGLEGMKELEFNKVKIRAAIKRKAEQNKYENVGLIKEVSSLYLVFPIRIPEKKLEADLQLIYSKYGISRKASATHITRWFAASRTSDKDKVKNWKITGLK